MSGPTDFNAELSRLLGDMRTVTCPTCGEGVMVRGQVTTGECSRCERDRVERESLAVQAEAVLAAAESWLPAWCDHAGLARREATARLELVPAGVKSALGDPRLHVKSMTAGEVPASGFGLIGTTGTGKTFALAALVQKMALERWRRLAPAHGLKVKRQFLRWVRWPEVVAEFRLRAMNDKTHEKVADLVDLWSTTEALVLDDLGAERMRSDYSEDWTASLLDVVLDRRHNAMLPTWWTSNLEPDELVARYGSRLWSRLTGPNPAVRIAGGTDLRLVRKGPTDGR